MSIFLSTRVKFYTIANYCFSRRTVNGWVIYFLNSYSILFAILGILKMALKWYSSHDTNGQCHNQSLWSKLNGHKISKMRVWEYPQHKKFEFLSYCSPYCRTQQSDFHEKILGSSWNFLTLFFAFSKYPPTERLNDFVQEIDWGVSLLALRAFLLQGRLKTMWNLTPFSDIFFQ